MSSYHPQKIEPKWQAYWLKNKTFATRDFVVDRPKLYILDMFPYPSGAGLHVGHPEGYTATDILCRYKRMRGFNVLHPMGWDAFGLPAEQYAIKTGTHPAVTTKVNVDNFRRQIQSLGFSYDWDREVDTTDPDYYRWTQWIFLQIHDTWYDPAFPWTDPGGHPRVGKGRPIADLPIPDGTADVESYRDSKRLAYRAEVPVNWCPGLGTVLANEEVIDGLSEVGGFPVVRLPLKQWMLRITAYADRLAEDIEALDWSRAIKEQQKNWIGRSEGAEVDFGIAADPAAWAISRTESGFPAVPGPDAIRVFTTRPDTLFGATYMVLAPEHPLVDRLTTPEQRDAVAAYRDRASAKSDMDRTDLAKTKTGVATGSLAINPVNGRPIPIWVADYVLMGYGTGAIMAVPAHDDRDFAFARAFGLPIERVVSSNVEEADFPLHEADAASGVAVNSSIDRVDFAGTAIPGTSLDGLPTAEAKSSITWWLDKRGFGRLAVNYKLRDWLFSRQRYWGEPFPVLLGEGEEVRAVPESELPVVLPELADFKPSGRPEPPLGKATEWVRYSEAYRRETNTMPQWAGSCWYYLRYIDPKNSEMAFDPEKERYWMPVDLYVGGAEHAVLHLLYARFWQKVLFDRGHVSTLEPFQKLVNQGMILGEIEYRVNTLLKSVLDEPELPTSVRSFSDPIIEGEYVLLSAEDAESPEVEAFLLTIDTPLTSKPGIIPLDRVEIVGKYPYWSNYPGRIRLDASAHKMSKSRGNVVNPDTIVANYGADSLRLYEMFIGPLDAVKPWSTKGVEGVYRFLGRAWRMIVEHEADEVRIDPRVRDVEPDAEQAKLIARTVAAVTGDLERMSFNTAIPRLMEFTNVFTSQDVRPRSAMETFTLLLSPFAPHLAEELWMLLGHNETLAYEPWPDYDPKLLVDEEVEIPIQVNGKVRARIRVAADMGPEELEAVARSDARIVEWIHSKAIKNVIVRPGKLVNFVVE